MIELVPTVWVSERASFSGDIVLGRNIRIFGPAKLQEGILVEDGVTIGHPSPAEVEAARAGLSGTGGRKLLDLGIVDRYLCKPTVIGPGSTVRSGTVIYSGVTTGARFDCGHGVTVREDCTFGDDCYLKVNTEVRRGVTVGHRATLAGTIGDRSRLGSDVTSFGNLMHKYREVRRGRLEVGPILEDWVFVGRNACVIGPVRLGKGCYVTAGAIVTKDVAPGALVVGVVARVLPGASPVRPRTPHLSPERRDEEDARS